ncbi:MAG: hypothetical protein EAX95_13405 [Candidatus Thorarchaeota archaeon]|nr:hypothetical protein [Candidatus Thorarchaeota archaeon]
MKIVYKKWNADEGLEDIQAQIYTEASGLPAQGWQIRDRNIQRGEDATRYALTDDGKPLAYVTSSISDSEPGRANIGYPWTMPDCPPEVQKTLFKEQFEYLKNREDIDRITTGVVLRSKIKDKQVEFFKKLGFTEHEKYVQYSTDLDVGETAKMQLEGKAAELTARAATEKDIDLLVDLCLTDENLRQAFVEREGFVSYFKDRVFPVRAPTILFKGDEAVAATAPLRTDPGSVSIPADGERIILRFRALKPGYEYAWERLLVELAKDCKKAGWTDIPIVTAFGFRADGPEASAIIRMKPEFREYEDFYIFRKEK